MTDIEQVELLKDLVHRYQEVRKLEDEVSALKSSYKRATESNRVKGYQYDELKSAHDDLWKAYHELLEELARVNDKDHVWSRFRLDDIVYIQHKGHRSPSEYYKAIVTYDGLVALGKGNDNRWAFDEADQFIKEDLWVAIHKEIEYKELVVS